MKISREFKVGVIFVFCALALYWGVNFLMGSDVFASQKMIYGVYDNTQGLDPGRPVNINGNRVGIVASIDFAPDYSGNLIVTFELTKDYPIPSNSMAVIAGDVLGNKRVDIILGDGTESLMPNDTIPTGVQPGLTEAVNEQLAPLKAKTEKLLGSLDTALAVFQGFLTKETREDFKSSFHNLNKSFENLESITQQINEVMPEVQDITENLAGLTKTLNENSGKLDTIFSNFASISDTLAKAQVGETMRQLAATTTRANELLTKVNNGEGTLGQLMNDRELYDNLTKASQSLDRLLLDIRYNPNRYIEFSVFGTNPAYTPEEIDQLEKEREQQNSGDSDN
ncbi:MAG: MCE family protein [Flavobacteriia bacterium]|nr:MCE family protein [Flavobacteriia bacterium]